MKPFWLTNGLCIKKALHAQCFFYSLKLIIFCYFFAFLASNALSVGLTNTRLITSAMT